MCTPKELVPDVLPRGDNLGVDLGVFWRCFGDVPGSSIRMLEGFIFDAKTET